MGGHTLELTEASFDELVESSDRPVLVDFFGTHCPPCKALSPIIDDLSAAYAGRAHVGKVNVDDNVSLAARFSISAVPTVVILHNGKIMNRFVGLRPKAEFQEAMDGLVDRAGVEE